MEWKKEKNISTMEKKGVINEKNQKEVTENKGTLKEEKVQKHTKCFQ